MDRDDGDRLLINQRSAPGLSGGPLLDAYGFATGTAVEDSGFISAWFLPMSQARPLLEKIPPSKRILDLDRALREHRVDLQQLALELRRNPPRSVELVAWAVLIRDDPTGTSYDPAFFSCPFGNLLIDRGLSEYVLGDLRRHFPVATVTVEDELHRIEVEPTLRDIFFEKDSAALSPEARAALKEAALVYKRALAGSTAQDVALVVSGHNSGGGGLEYTQTLTDSRAMVAKCFLLSEGVDATRIKTISYGDDRAVLCPPDPPAVADECVKKNSRVHLEITREGNWRSFQDPYSKARGNCAECQDGEAMAVSKVKISPGLYVDINDPPCGDAAFQTELPAEVKAGMAAFFYSQAGPDATFAAGIADATFHVFAQGALVNEGEIGRWVRRDAMQRQVSSCARAAVILPKSVNITRVVPAMDCPAGGLCNLAGQAATSDVDTNLVGISVIGKNWSHDQAAFVILKVFYKR